MSEQEHTSAFASVRRHVAAHPVAAMLLLLFVIGWGILFPAALAGVPLIPLPLLSAALFAMLGSSVFVTWAVEGWPGVRRMFGRVFRWRVHPAWYVFALFAVPVGTLLWTAAFFGGGALHALFTDRTVILSYLSSLTILPVANLWEENAWMGMIQGRLEAYRGPLLAAVITGPLFGLFHAPIYYSGPTFDFLLPLAVLMVIAIPFRMLLGWVYNATGGSILMVATLHVTWNFASSTTLWAAAAPGQAILQPGHGAAIATVLALAIIGLIVTRGRLGYRQDEGFTRAPARPVGAEAQ